MNNVRLVCVGSLCYGVIDYLLKVGLGGRSGRTRIILRWYTHVMHALSKGVLQLEIDTDLPVFVRSIFFVNPEGAQQSRLVLPCAFRFGVQKEDYCSSMLYAVPKNFDTSSDHTAVACSSSSSNSSSRVELRKQDEPSPTMIIS